MTWGRRNTAQINLLSAALQARNDPSFAWSRAVSNHLFLPKLRAFWPFSSVDVSGNPQDMSEQGTSMTAAGTPTYGVYGLVPYGDINGSSQYWTAAPSGIGDNFTIGFWVRFNRATGTQEALVSNWAFGSGFVVTRQSTGVIRFSVNGVSFDSTDLIVRDQWHHIVAEFTPSTSMKLWLDGVLAINGTASVPATAVSGSTFYVGRANGGTYLDGQITLGFLSRASIGETFAPILYHHGRAMFGR